MAKKNRRVKLSSLLIVCEGPHDKAFINHLKDLYDNRNTGQKVKVESADGGSPRDILKSASKNKHADYDKKYVLMDSDIPVTQQDWDFARNHKIEIIQSTPCCLEGMLLDALGEQVPDGNSACKGKFHSMLEGAPTEKKSYSIRFSKEIVDGSEKEQLVTLRKLLSNT
ncbi:RloB domain-containing protein [Marinomonas agarivorans]|nr:RloB domain-containing protein [Marinomonas agarivorans]